MALSGQLIWGPISNGAYFSFEWTAKQNITARTSTVSWKMYGRGRSSSPTYIASNYHLSIDGSEVSALTGSWDGSSKFSFNNAQKDSGSFTVYHDSSGAGSFYAEIYAYISSGSYNWDTVGETFELDNIGSSNYSWKYLGSGSTSSVSYNLSEKQVGYYLYTPSSAGTITIYTSSSDDSYGCIGVNGSVSLTSDSSAYGPNIVSGYIANDDDSGTNSNFQVSGVSLSANITYIIYVHQYSGGAASGTLYMSFTKTYTVTYDANGGSGIMSSHTNITPGNSIKLQANGFTVPPSAVHGITLYDSDGTTRISSADTSFYNNAFYRWLINGNYYKPGDDYKPSSNTTVKATWSTNYRLGSATKNPTKLTGYVITYNSNGGNCSRKTDTITDTISYEFSKWIIISFSGNEYNPGTLIGGPATYSYKAKWNTSKELGSITLPNAYKNNSEIIATITLNPTKGKCDIISMTSKGIISYSFNGWYFNNEYIGTAGDSYTPSNNITLTANYTSSTGSYNRIFLPTPYRSGYKFLGWSTNPNAKSGIFGYYTPIGNDTLYAIWQENFIFINVNGLMKKAQAFIFNNNKWNETQIFINNNNQWNKTG